MIKLKDILFEAKVAHTQKSLQWVYHDYIPMTPKVIKQIMGDTPILHFIIQIGLLLRINYLKLLVQRNQYQHITQVKI